MKPATIPTMPKMILPSREGPFTKASQSSKPKRNMVVCDARDEPCEEDNKQNPRRDYPWIRREFEPRWTRYHLPVAFRPVWIHRARPKIRLAAGTSAINRRARHKVFLPAAPRRAGFRGAELAAGVGIPGYKRPRAPPCRPLRGTRSSRRRYPH